MKLAISLGGSLLVPELPPRRKNFVKYANLLKYLYEQGHNLVVVCGGGETARKYQAIPRGLAANIYSIDQIGIEACWINAITLAAIIDQTAVAPRQPHSEAIKYFGKKILICGGEGTGHSSDYATVRLAKLVKADLIINATNVDGIYNKDPNKYKSAKLIPEITYESYLERFGQKWKPGMHAPFDFEAARLMLAGLPRIPTRVVNGQRLENILGAAEGKNIGTLLN